MQQHLFRIDRERGIPVGTQLGWHLRRLIAGGRLVPGDRLPSVRQLADAAGVHVNTARSVYGRLEAQGYVTSEQGRGTFVATDLPTTQRQEQVERLASELEAGARDAGLDLHEVVAHLYGSEARSEGHEGAQAGGPPDPVAPTEEQDRGASARRELRRQIAALEARLVRHPAAHLEGGDPPSSGRRPRAGLPSAEDLVQVRDELADRLRRADALRAEVLDDLRRSEEASQRPSSERTVPARSSASLAGVRVRFTGGP